MTDNNNLQNYILLNYFPNTKSISPLIGRYNDIEDPINKRKMYNNDPDAQTVKNGQLYYYVMVHMNELAKSKEEIISQIQNIVTNQPFNLDCVGYVTMNNNNPSVTKLSNNITKDQILHKYNGHNMMDMIACYR